MAIWWIDCAEATHCKQFGRKKQTITLLAIVYHRTVVYICKTIYQTNSIHHFMKTLKSILAALALTVAATASAQTLKMEHQVAGVTTYEASTAVNLVVVKPEILIILT